MSCCCSKLVLRPSHLDRACLSLVASLFSLLSFLCCLPSSLLGLDPFRYHPVILRPNHCVLRPSHLDRACLSLLASRFSLLSSLFSLLSSLFSRCCSFRRSHFAPVTPNFASGQRIRFQSTRPFASLALARRNARSDETTIRQ